MCGEVARFRDARPGVIVSGAMSQGDRRGTDLEIGDGDRQEFGYRWSLKMRAESGGRVSRRE